MGDVKWIKFYVSILTNKKIKRIRKLPEGDTIALIWAFLLAQAGESNKDGGIYFNDEIPYSPEDFASDYDFKPTTVQLAVTIFEKYGMIGVFDGIIYVKNWDKYQSIDSMERMKEQNRLRQSSFKERKKLAQSNVIGNVSSNAEVTQGNATDIELELEEDIDKDIKKKNSRFVPPTPEEIKLYCTERKNQVDANKLFDFYTANGWVQGKGKPIKDWKACVRTWEGNDKKDKPKTSSKFNNHEQREYTEDKYAEIERASRNKGL